MDNAELSAYIATCRAQGIPDEQIHALLKEAGWRPEDLQGALPMLPAAASGGSLRRSRVKEVVKWIALSLGSLILLLIVSVAVAEQGYLPAFSRLYRKTALPLIWHGTNGSAALTVVKVLQTGSLPTSEKADYSVTLNLKKINESKPILFGKSTLYSPLAEVTGENTQVLATVGTNASGSLPLFDQTKLLPLTVGSTVSSTKDKDNNLAASFNLDLTGLDKAFNPQEKPNTESKLTVEVKGIIADKKLYLRGNFFPYLAVADKNKWIGFTLADDVIEKWKKPDRLADQLTPEEQKEFEDLADSMIQDRGIIRDGGHPYALYHLHVDQVVLRKMAANPKLKQYKETITELINQDTPTFDYDVEIDPHSAQVHSVKGTVATVSSQANINSLLALSAVTSYDSDERVATPAATERIKEEGSKYFNQVETMLVGWETGSAALVDTTWFGNSRIALALKELWTQQLNQIQEKNAASSKGVNVAH